MHAVVLAGGEGTRLRPYTVTLPKPLLPVGDRPMLEVVLRQLQAAGFTRATLAVNHQADLLRAFFGDGTRFGIAIDYSQEDTPLSTIGPLKLFAERLPERFLVMNGDLLTDFNFAELLAFHSHHDALLTVATFRRSVPSDFGVVELSEGNLIAGFQEKPVQHYDVSMGIYAMDRRLLDEVPPGRCFGFDELMALMLRRGLPVRAFPYDGIWLDIGRPDDYARAQDVLEQNRERFLP